MAEFLFEYGIFLAKAVTVIVTVAVLLILIAGFSRRGPAGSGLTIEKLNDKYREMADLLQQAVLNKAAWKKREKAEKKDRKRQRTVPLLSQRRQFRCRKGGGPGSRWLPDRTPIPLYP